ncbi:PEP-CTERM sorting domain-containing protein [Undibacterium sp. Jales W-56]|uniref:PEP-CTERM sorting domain-containing protein n=1 Tax=Undibacterium sp. Jales W-56 TaxID=2897325 RepID=UPI0021D2D283|nr:PEP-CTERM sorting domain-containing protein [Undibacterium sp. Jales W-56]MCU6432966.1 PEP-CTERM sorting domain-containing protein [Undibacterium sp. Jales W-56]
MKLSQGHRWIRAGLAMLCTLAMAMTHSASASIVGYHSDSAFATSLTGLGLSSSTVNFDALAAGTTYSTGTGTGGLTFSLSSVDILAMPAICNLFWTTSGSNYLGLNNNDCALEAGDALTINFAGAARGFGLWVIGGSDLSDGDVTLSSGADSVSNLGPALLTDGAGSFAYFLGLVGSNSGDTFSSVTLSDLTPSSTRLLAISLDDLVVATAGTTNQVPEPASLALLAVGLCLLLRRVTGAGSGEQS